MRGCSVDVEGAKQAASYPHPSASYIYILTLGFGVWRLVQFVPRFTSPGWGLTSLHYSPDARISLICLIDIGAFQFPHERFACERWRTQAVLSSKQSYRLLSEECR